MQCLNRTHSNLYSILQIRKCIDMRLYYNNNMHILGIVYCQQSSTKYQTCISQQQQRVTRPAGLSKDKKIVFFIATCLFIASMIGYNLRGYYYIAFEPEKESLSIEQKSKMKLSYLQKHYNQGLKQYYQQIEQTITIIKTRVKEQNVLIQQYRIIINGFEHCDRQLCQQAIASVINKLPGIQIIWMTKSNRFKLSRHQTTYFDILTQFLSLNGVQFDVVVQDISANYFFGSKHIGKWVGQWVLFLTNFMIVQSHTIDQFIKQADDFAIYAHKLPAELSINKKANLSTISRHNIIQNAYLMSYKMLKIITPLNFAYQDLYKFQELLIIPSLALFQLVQRVKQHNFINFNIKKSRQNKNVTEFRLKQRPKQIKQNRHICFIGTPTQPSINQIQQLNNYLGVFEDYLRDKREVQPFSVVVGLLYQIDNLPLLKLQQAIKKALNLSSLGSNTRFRIRSNKIVASLQMYEGSRRYCPESSTIFSSRFNTHPNIKEIYQNIQYSDLCRSNNLYLIPNYMDENKKKSDLERIDIKNSIENKQRRQYIPLHTKYFFNAVIVCSQLILSMRLSVFKWEAHQFYETQASFSIAMLEKGRTNQYFSSFALYKVVNPRNMSELEKKQIKGMQYRQIQRQIYKGRQSYYTLSELNNHGYKNNAPEIIPKIIHQIWLSNEKQPQPVKAALAETLRSANPDFEYKLWTWQNVTRDNFPVTYDGILKIIKVCKLLNQNYLAAATDMMRIELLFRYGGFYMDFKTEGKRSLQPFLRYQQMYHIADKKSLLNSFIATVQGNRHFYQILKQFCNPNYYPFLFMSSLSWKNTGGEKIASSYLEREMYTEVLDFRQFISGGQQPCMYSFDPKPLDPDQKLFTGVTTFSSKYEYKVKIPCKRDLQKYLQYYDMLGRSYHQKSTSSYS